MKTNNPRSRWAFAALLSILLVTLACSMPLGGPTPPTDRTPAAETPIADLIGSVQNAAAGEPLHLQFTEGQLTYLLLQSVANYPGDLQVQDPIVILRDEKIEVYGRAATEFIEARFLVTLSVAVDESGRLQAEIVSADFGGVSVPESIRARLQDALDNSIQDALNPATNRFRVTDVIITDGLLTLNGTVQ